MTLVIVKIFVILIAGVYLITGENARQFFYTVDHNKRESVALSEIKVAQLTQHPYNLFKNKREFVKLAERYIKNQKKYHYDQYKSYNSSKKVVAFNCEYVNKVLNSLNLLQTSQNQSKIINGATENPVVKDNTTLFKDMSSTTEKFKLNSMETTERSLTQTTEIYKVTTSKSANKIDLMELPDSTNITTLVPTVEDLTTEGEILNLLPTNLDNEDVVQDTTTERSVLLDITTQNFEESIPSLNKVELKNETTFSVEIETSTMEDIQSATSFIIFNLTSTENLIDVYNPEDIISITTEPAELITELYENTSSTNYEGVPVTEENLTLYKSEPSESKTSFYEKSTTLNAMEYTTTTDTYDSTLSAYFNGSLEPIDITSDSDTDIYTIPLVSNNLTEDTTISIVTNSTGIEAEYIRTTTNPTVIGSIVDDTYDDFEANVSLNDSSTQIFETITYSPNSERFATERPRDSAIMLGELISESTMDSNCTTIGSITQQITTEFSPMTTESTFSSEFDWKTTQTETTTEFPFQGLIAKYSDSMPVNKGTINQIDNALNIENKTEVVKIDFTKAMNMATDKTNTNDLADTNIDNSTTENTLKLKVDKTLDTPTYYNSTNAATKNLKTYDNTISSFDKVHELSTRIFSDKTPHNGQQNRKSKKFKYATDVMPTLGDYDDEMT